MSTQQQHNELRDLVRNIDDVTSRRRLHAFSKSSHNLQNLRQQAADALDAWSRENLETLLETLNTSDNSQALADATREVFNIQSREVLLRPDVQAAIQAMLKRYKTSDQGWQLYIVLMKADALDFVREGVIKGWVKFHRANTFLLQAGVREQIRLKDLERIAPPGAIARIRAENEAAARKYRNQGR